MSDKQFLMVKSYYLPTRCSPRIGDEAESL